MNNEFQQGVAGYSPQVASPQNADVSLRDMIKRLLLASTLMLAGCATNNITSTAHDYNGNWSIRYLPSGKQALDYVTEKKPLPPSQEGCIQPLGEEAMLKANGTNLMIGEKAARLYRGNNGEIEYSYARWQDSSEFGTETILISPGHDGKLYGVWSRIFWGLDSSTPPMVSMERFIMERK